MLIIEIVSYFGLLGLQSFLAVRGLLTEQRFALFQVASLALIAITAVLYYSSPEYPFGLIAGGIGTTIFAIIGYPIARWIYRQFNQPK